MKSTRAAWRHAAAVATCLSLFLIAGCAGGPGIASRRVPEWVLAPPENTDEYEYFVASASNPSDTAAAEEAAGYALLNQINQALGVEITVETSAEARSSLDSYEADLVQQVTQRGTGRVDGLRIADRYVGEQADGIVVYLLGQYEREAFETERARRRSLLRQSEELLTGPEDAGDSLVEQGRVTQGIMQYGQAALAAADSDLEIAPVVLERVLQKAAEAGNRLELSVLSGPATALLGVEMEQGIEFLLTDDRNRPVGGAALEISYVERRGNRDVVRTVDVFTGADGVALFNHPLPARVGESAVTARLDVQSLLSMLDSLPRSLQARVDAVADAVVNVRATHRFVVLSEARTIPTALSVIDLDAAGNVMPSRDTDSGLLAALTDAGFQIRPLDLAAEELAAGSVSRIVNLVRGQADSSVRRVVFGTARIDETRTEDGYLVRVSGSVIAVDLETGAVLYTATGIKNARSRSADRAVATAFLELGRQLGEELVANLP